MWGDSGTYNQGGGGFLNDSFASPSAEGGEKKSSREKRAENVVSVTIRQILASHDNFRISELPVHVLTFVAVVKDVEPSATKITYVMEDSTGQIQVVQFLDGTSEEEKPLKDTYCRVYGTVRANQGTQYVMAFKIRSVVDLNELTSHLLEVVDVHLCAPLLSSEPDMTSLSVSVKTEQMSNSMMSVGGAMDSMGVSNSRHKTVLGVIGEMAQLEDSGVNVQVIAQKLKGTLNFVQVRESVDYLLQEGFIFTTVDDDHYTITR